ncbi:MAG: UDP-N-acetylmuramoyl-tripeptide--D-alanyl-D-alanine ligase [Candidatus Babeliales bacterium]|jgi:UDP-N-acetylmuramoyl-tripeptide--D-alanyl-D-alanine ligase
MKITQEFLTNALPYATFYCGDTPMTDALWQTYEQHVEIGVSFDSRTITEHELFVPLPGSNCDGHDFIEMALRRGACGSLVSAQSLMRYQALPTECTTHKLFIVVPDVQTALCDLARAWRKRFVCPVVGITGSLGKTSTKEMLRSILSAIDSDAYVSFKNYNNVLGVSYNLLRIPSSVTTIVLEMGINDIGEMRQLVDLVQPTIGVVTCVAHVHTEGLGNSLIAVAREKCEIFSQFTQHNVGIVCGDQPSLAKRSYPHKVAFFGARKRNQVHARNVRIVAGSDGLFMTEFNLHWFDQKALVRMRGNHPSIVHNALAASTVAYFLHIPLNAVVAGLEAYSGTKSRFEVKKIKYNRGMILDDCYNAGPESMRAALQAFATFTATGLKIAVLGDMLELGHQELRWHRAIGRFIARRISAVDRLILVGKRAHVMREVVPSSLVCNCVDDWQAAAHELENLLEGQSDAVILVKASHGMHLDEIVKILAE